MTKRINRQKGQQNNNYEKQVTTAKHVNLGPTAHSPDLCHGSPRGGRFGGLPLYAGVGVDTVLPGLTLGVQGDVRRRVADFHRDLRGRQHLEGRGHRRGRGLHHRHHRRHRGGLAGGGERHAGLTADVGRRVHGRVHGLPWGQVVRGQRCHGGVVVALGLLGPEHDTALPPWYPAELPGDEEGHSKQGQATGCHYQGEQAHRHIWREGNQQDAAKTMFESFGVR